MCIPIWPVSSGVVCVGRGKFGGEISGGVTFGGVAPGGVTSSGVAYRGVNSTTWIIQQIKYITYVHARIRMCVPLSGGVDFGLGVLEPVLSMN